MLPSLVTISLSVSITVFAPPSKRPKLLNELCTSRVIPFLMPSLIYASLNSFFVTIVAASVSFLSVLLQNPQALFNFITKNFLNLLEILFLVERVQDFQQFLLACWHSLFFIRRIASTCIIQWREKGI